MTGPRRHSKASAQQPGLASRSSFSHCLFIFFCFLFFFGLIGTRNIPDLLPSTLAIININTWFLGHLNLLKNQNGEKHGALAGSDSCCLSLSRATEDSSATTLLATVQGLLAAWKLLSTSIRGRVSGSGVTGRSGKRVKPSPQQIKHLAGPRAAPPPSPLQDYRRFLTSTVTLSSLAANHSHCPPAVRNQVLTANSSAANVSKGLLPGRPLSRSNSPPPAPHCQAQGDNPHGHQYGRVL